MPREARIIHLCPQMSQVENEVEIRNPPEFGSPDRDSYQNKPDTWEIHYLGVPGDGPFLMGRPGEHRHQIFCCPFCGANLAEETHASSTG